MGSTPSANDGSIERADLDARGWDAVDVVFVTGDAYVDHPSFAAALLGRLLGSRGYRVAVLARPDPDDVAQQVTFGTSGHRGSSFDGAFNEALRKAGTMVNADQLQPTMTAATVRPGADGEAQVLNGPYIDTKEALGGYYLIEAPDQAAALPIAGLLAPWPGRVDVLVDGAPVS